MADVDFDLAEGDTAPVLRMQVLAPPDPTDPDFEQYPFGRPLDLTDAVVSVKLRIEDESADGFVKVASIDGDPQQGWIIFDWDGYPPGRYRGRVKVVQNNGKRISWPNNRTFILFVHADPVASDYVPPASETPVVRSGANLTFDAQEDMVGFFAALDTTTLLPGSTFVRVRGLTGLFALDAAASNGGVANPDAGIYASTDEDLLWVNF